jgi:hypothetical protein
MWGERPLEQPLPAGEHLRGSALATLGHMKERTIGFYEIVTVADGQASRTRQMDWDGALADVSRVPIAGRTINGDAQLVGTIATYNMQDHLLLHRVKDGGEWLSVMNWDTGDLRELEQSAHEGLPGHIRGVFPSVREHRGDHARGSLGSQPERPPGVAERHPDVPRHPV